MKTAKTIRFRKVLKADQAAKFIVEVEVTGADGKATWRQVRSFTERARAEGFLEGYKKGLQHFDTAATQTAVPDLQDEWPKD